VSPQITVHITQRSPKPTPIQTHHTHTARDTPTDRPYNKCTRTLKISNPKRGNTTLKTAHPVTTTHSAHQQAF